MMKFNNNKTWVMFLGTKLLGIYCRSQWLRPRSTGEREYLSELFI